MLVCCQVLSMAILSVYILCRNACTDITVLQAHALLWCGLINIYQHSFRAAFGLYLGTCFHLKDASYAHSKQMYKSMIWTKLCCGCL